MRHACVVCGVVSDQRRCSRHRGKPGTKQWSPTRDRAKQAKLRKLVLERDGYQCTYVDPRTKLRCEETEDLRAAHIRSIRDGGGYNPSEARTLCRTHDRMTDPHAR